MAIPSVNQLSQTPGGGMVAAMIGQNALTTSNLANQYSALKNKYAPLTLQADAASKLAYANLMGPQFLAKLMGNPDIVANLTDDQKRAALMSVQQAGMGGGTGNSLMNMPNLSQQGGNQNNNSLSSWLWKKLTGQNQGQQNQSPMPQPNVNNGGQDFGANNRATNAEIDYVSQNGNGSAAQVQPSYSLTPKDQKSMNNMQPGDSYVVGSGQPPQQAPQMGQAPRMGGATAGQLPTSTYAENAANFAGIKKEGEEAGTIRARDIKDLNDTAFNGETNQTTLDSLGKILASPEFEGIRQLPLAGHHELAYYAKEGTPQQQNVVGQYYTLTGNVIKDSARDFAGQFRKGEQQLLQGMKPNPSDTVDTARGKAEVLTYMNQMLTQRSKLTAQLMTQYHINKGQAQDLADKQINGPKIRQQIHDKLNPTITIRNKKTGKTMTVPVSDARDKYGVQRNV